MYDTIIIGAGMSGLAAGIRLAHFGQRVCLLERHTAIGGLNSFYRQRGRIFDVGLHAITNFVPKGTRTGPFAQLLRQLRFAWEEWALSPQLGSAIMFPGVTLRFSNEIELLEGEVRRHFPRQIDNFRRLATELIGYDQFGRPGGGRSARKVVGDMIDDPLLVEMIFCPILFYGGSQAHDMDFDQFSILFRAIFLEGLARPLAGIQAILKMLAPPVQGARRRASPAGGRQPNRRQATAPSKRSSWKTAPSLNPQRPLVGGLGRDAADVRRRPAPDVDLSGRLSFVESISILNRQPSFARLRQDDRLLQRFGEVPLREARRSGRSPQRNDLLAEQFRLRRAAGRGRDADFGAGELRPLESARRGGLPRGEARLVRPPGNVGARFVPDFRPAVVETDMFTPLTIHRFTGHRRRRDLRFDPQEPQRHHAPAESLHLRQRPGPGRHRRRHHQRHQHRQPASAEVAAASRRYAHSKGTLILADLR